MLFMLASSTLLILASSTLFMLANLTLFMLTNSTLFMLGSSTLFMLASSTLFMLANSTLFMLASSTLFMLTNSTLFMLATSTLSKPVNKGQTCCAFLRMYIKMIIEMENSTTHSRSRVWFCYMPHGLKSSFKEMGSKFQISICGFIIRLLNCLCPLKHKYNSENVSFVSVFFNLCSWLVPVHFSHAFLDAKRTNVTMVVFSLSSCSLT